ncbi:inverse autotransporter beta domain-containing protein [Symbiopectobacterium purcellii]|uniref:inverse autotransporter beta domain-containing protein n=1 Tax=Symbiopectobacterium purcellii TaxID=2871826 RepID=UPI003F831BDC
MSDNWEYGFFRPLGMVFVLIGCSQVNKSDERTHTSVIKFSKEEAGRSVISPSLSGSASSQHSSMSSKRTDIKIRGEAQARLSTPGRQFESTSLNVLVPLQENENRILFSQFGGHHRKHKNSASVGVGQRHFGNDWGLGYNLFYDVQKSKSVYHRLGVGGELWFDHARFTANGYYGLTRNRDVDEKPGYYADVAHGYDVNLQAWIPGYRQLSGRVKFEQYFGDSVALTKKGKDARNPHALSLGLSYAPIPLLQFDVDRVLGGQSQAENRFGVSVRYQFGVPLSLQLYPTYTASQYLRKAKNYHVVDRNNDIKLSFREKSLEQIEKPVVKVPAVPKPPTVPPASQPPKAPTPSGAPERPKPPVVTPEGDPCFECGDLEPGKKPSVDDEPLEDEDSAVSPKGAPERPKPPVVTPEGDPCLECGDLEPGEKTSVDDESFEDEDREINPKGAPEWPEPPVVAPGGDPCLECGDLEPVTKPKYEVEVIDIRRDIYVYPPSPDGMLLRAIPDTLERHVLVDEAEGAEGFVIVEPPPTKRDSSDVHDGFEFVNVS